MMSSRAIVSVVQINDLKLICLIQVELHCDQDQFNVIFFFTNGYFVSFEQKDVFSPQCRKCNINIYYM